MLESYRSSDYKLSTAMNARRLIISTAHHLNHKESEVPPGSLSRSIYFDE
jgi:hypothetical protein